MTPYLPLVFIPVWGVIVYLLARAQKRRTERLIEAIRQRQESP